jgi:hypothetical protein
MDSPSASADAAFAVKRNRITQLRKIVKKNRKMPPPARAKIPPQRKRRNPISRWVGFDWLAVDGNRAAIGDAIKARVSERRLAADHDRWRIGVLDVTNGIPEASTTRIPSSPRTLRSGVTTASGPEPQRKRPRGHRALSDGTTLKRN